MAGVPWRAREASVRAVLELGDMLEGVVLYSADTHQEAARAQPAACDKRTIMRDKLEKIIEGYAELQGKLGDPAVLADQKEYARLSKEYANQGPLVAASISRRATTSMTPKRCLPIPT